MAEKRMFAKSVTECDKFYELPLSSQALYMHLSMNADDDGMLGSVKMIQRMTGANDNDLDLLVMRGYLIRFDSGVYAITHWNVNNTLKKDRYKESVYKNELATLGRNPDKTYFINLNSYEQEKIETRMEPNWNQIGTVMEPEWNQYGTNMEPSWNHDQLSQQMQNAESRIKTEKNKLSTIGFQNGTIVEPQDSISNSKDINNNIHSQYVSMSVRTDGQTIEEKREILESIKTSWNSLKEFGIAPIRDFNPDRAFRIFSLVDKYGLDSFSEVVEKIKSNDFLLGKKQAFKVSFKWILEERHYLDVLEDAYLDYGDNSNPIIKPFQSPRQFNQYMKREDENLSDLEAKLLEN